MRTGHTALWLAALIWLTGCATSSPAPSPAPYQERFTLLPQAGQGPGAVVVQSGGKTLVLDRPYAVALASGQSLQADTTDAAAVQARYQTVLEALPPRPQAHALYFELGNAQLTAASKLQVEEILRFIQSLPAPRLLIIGHTDAVGTPALNEALALERAEVVHRLIREKGFPVGSIQVEGRGHRDPLVPTPPGMPEPRNRRVDIIVR